MANLMTVLEARVPQSQWEALKAAGQNLPALPPGLERTYVTQSSGDPELWRVVGFWASREAFEAMRQAMGTPPPVTMFRSLGVEPTLALFDIVAQASA